MFNDFDSLKELNKILIDLVILPDSSLRIEDDLERLAMLCCRALSFEACNITEVDHEREELTQMVCTGFDAKFKNFMAEHKISFNLDVKKSKINPEIIYKGEFIAVDNLQEDGNGVANPKVAKPYNLKSSLCCPLKSQKNNSYLIGYLNIFSAKELGDYEDQRKLLEAFGRKAETIIDNFRTTRESQIIEKINKAVREMTQSRNIEQICKILLRVSCEITDATWGWIRHVNFSAGQLETITVRGMKNHPEPLKYGDGATWHALTNEKPILIPDIKNDEKWKDLYVQQHPLTRSELMIPLLIENIQVRQGTKAKSGGSRPFGIIYLENPKVGVFSQRHITLLEPLLHQAMFLIDSLQTEAKLKGLLEVERKIVKEKNWREVLKIFAEEVKNKLGFDWVNISLVSKSENLIKTEYILGLETEEKRKAFMEKASHSLDSDDIQADIVRTKKIEVPDKDDKRFDVKIFQEFWHENLARVFIPIFSSSIPNEIIGTVEAGYPRAYRNSIDERDIQFLQIFINSITEAIDPRNLDTLAKIRHELRSSIFGIINNAIYLQHRWKNIPHEMMRLDLSASLVNGFDLLIKNKTEDIKVDCDILQKNADEIEYLLGRSRTSKKIIERTYLMRDIVFKTANQLRPFANSLKLNPQKIWYNPQDAKKINVFVEKSRINQVVYNILINAIKYAKKDKNQFQILITVEETRSEFKVKYSDYGIGIREEYRKKIFESNFRAPEAKEIEVQGSGLGLTIAKAYMNKVGGDLVLENLAEPTVFTMIVPKNLEEKTQ